MHCDLFIMAFILKLICITNSDIADHQSNTDSYRHSYLTIIFDGHDLQSSFMVCTDYVLYMNSLHISLCINICFTLVSKSAWIMSPLIQHGHIQHTVTLTFTEGQSLIDIQHSTTNKRTHACTFTLLTGLHMHTLIHSLSATFIMT